MQKTFSFFILTAILLAGCGTSTTHTVPSVAAVRSYNGTASVGDFLTISIDSTTATITYQDLTNGQSGTVPYTVGSNGAYTIADPQSNLLAAYELPGYALLIEAAKVGPNQNTPALITAVENGPVSIANLAGKNYNYIQFRTTQGGLNIGNVSIDANGSIQHDSYSPISLIEPTNIPYFSGGSFAASSITEDPSGDFFTIDEQNSTADIVFGTQNGLWAVDTGAGAILGLPKATTKAFDPVTSGTYTALIYEKANAQNQQNNMESGTPTQGIGTVTVTSAGSITITDSQGNTLATGPLVAVADSSYLYDGTANELSDPCYGLFTVRIATATSQQDLFVSFQGNAAIFASFQSALPAAPTNPYTYFYGVGLK